MSQKRHRRPMQVMSDINVTNLLDTAFILIIVLMLIAPHLSQGIKLDLPTAASPSLDKDEKKTLIVSVKPKQEGQSEQIIVDDRRMTAEELFTMVQAEKAKRPDLVVQVDGDKNCSYGAMFEVLDAIKRAGVENVDLPSQPGPPAGEEETKKKAKQ